MIGLQISGFLAACILIADHFWPGVIDLLIGA